MKKTKIIALSAMLTASMVLCSCSTEPSQDNGTNGEALDNAKLTLLDGSTAFENEIVKFEKADKNNQSQTDNYTVNVCFGVPLKTSAEKRTAFEKGDWIKLQAGSEINGFTVEKAEAHYFQPVKSIDTDNLLFLPLKLVQDVTLNGDFSLTGEACKDLALDDSETGNIMITLDDESLKKLVSLKPALQEFNGYQGADNDDEYFDNEKIIFYISDKTEGFHQIMDKLSSAEKVNVKLETKSVNIRYTFETGISHDGYNVGTVNDGNVSLT